MILIYALGGGMGHTARAMAIAAQAPPDVKVRVLTSSDSQAQTTQDIHKLLGGLKPQDTLIVDVYPRGLNGELTMLLPRLACRKILVQRYLDERAYTASFPNPVNLKTFAEDNYDVVFRIEACVNVYANTIETAPWICIPPGLVAPTEPTGVLVVAAGNENEAQWYDDVCGHLNEMGVDYRCLSQQRLPKCPPDRHVNDFPGITHIQGAACCLGSGGYNTVYECLATGTPLIAKCWPRKFDNQHWRCGAPGQAQGAPGVKDNTVVVSAAKEAAQWALTATMAPSKVKQIPVSGVSGVSAIQSYLMPPGAQRASGGA